MPDTNTTQVSAAVTSMVRGARHKTPSSRGLQRDGFGAEENAQLTHEGRRRFDAVAVEAHHLGPDDGQHVGFAGMAQQHLLELLEPLLLECPGVETHLDRRRLLGGLEHGDDGVRLAAAEGLLALGFSPGAAACLRERLAREPRESIRLVLEKVIAAAP